MGGYRGGPTGTDVKLAAEYRQHAAECRKLASGSKTAGERQQLNVMAATWERLAEYRERTIARDAKSN